MPYEKWSLPTRGPNRLDEGLGERQLRGNIYGDPDSMDGSKAVLDPWTELPNCENHDHNNGTCLQQRDPDMSEQSANFLRLLDPPMEGSGNFVPASLNNEPSYFQWMQNGMSTGGADAASIAWINNAWGSALMPMTPYSSFNDTTAFARQAHGLPAAQRMEVETTGALIESYYSSQQPLGSSELQQRSSIDFNDDSHASPQSAPGSCPSNNGYRPDISYMSQIDPTTVESIPVRDQQRHEFLAASASKNEEYGTKHGQDEDQNAFSPVASNRKQQERVIPSGTLAFKGHERSCGLCGILLNDEVSAAKHYENQHIRGDSYRCPECRETFGTKCTRDCHLQKMHGEEDWIDCPCCFAKIRQRRLVDHIKSQRCKNERRPHKCEACGARFETGDALVGHYVLTH